jgi:hypothetical protein
MAVLWILNDFVRSRIRIIPLKPGQLNKWMRSSKGLQRLAVNAKAATVLGLIPASSDTVESDPDLGWEKIWIQDEHSGTFFSIRFLG